MSVPCPHGMPTPGSCVDCMYEGNTEPAPRPEAEAIEGGWIFPAAFPGQCPACDLPIVEGQMIGRTNRGRYVHRGCTP